MSTPLGSSQFFLNAAQEGGQSLRFEDGDSPYLSWTPASAGNRKTWTYSTWIKRANLGGTQLFGINSGDSWMIRFSTSDKIACNFANDTVTNYFADSTRVFRDPSAWYHIVVSCDTTQSTASDRVKIYVNGELETITGGATTIPQNRDTDINVAAEHRIGAEIGNRYYSDGYIANACFIDGQQLDPTSFGEYDGTLWKSKSDADIQSLTFGTNGFYLPFKQTTEAEGFSTVTYTGNGGTQSIEGVGFEPDFVWIKNRGAAYNHMLFDSVRGAGNYLESDTTDGEASGNHLTSFNSDGFTVGEGSVSNRTNYTGNSYVAWCWDAGSGSAASNTDGSITSTVKANTSKGFSIATYTGNGTSGSTFGHGLGVTPEMVIVKRRNTTAPWNVYTSVTGATKYLELDSTAAQATATNRWNDTAPTSSVVTIGNTNNVNGSGSTYVAYSFASISGYSKISSYTGTGTANLAVTGLGFRPAMVIIKRTDSADRWLIVDNTRTPFGDTENERLYLDGSNSESGSSATATTFDSDGFTLKGTNGMINASGGTYLYMAFADTRDATFFGDTSGNGNNWIPNALNNTDVVPDSPVTDNNFATLNPIQSLYSNSVTTFSEGNLKAALGNASNWRAAVATQQHSSGKWYYEVYANQGANGFIGFGHDNFDINGAAAYAGSTAGSWGWLVSGGLYNNTANIDALSSYTTGDIISIALDFDNAKAYWAKNGTWENSADPAAGTGGTSIDADKLYKMGFSNVSGYASTANFGQDSSFAGNATPQGNTDSNGVGDFYYAPPSGFLALTTGNLDVPAITAPDDYFNTVLWSGDGTSGRGITGVGFQPDFNWVKSRSGTEGHVLHDSVRGSDANGLIVLTSQSTAAESVFDATWHGNYGSLDSLDSDGFTVTDGSLSGTYNTSGVTYVAWNWLANGTGVSNTNGSINSTVSANPTAGFSIVSWTDDASTSSTVGHGLNSAPELIITKNRDGAFNWFTWTTVIDGSYDYFSLNLTDSKTDDSTRSLPTSSVFTNVGSTSGNKQIAYCFHSVDGYSKIGNYTGDGSADGPFIHCGFRPAWVMVKRSSNTDNWFVWDSTRDSYNLSNSALVPSLSYAESSITGDEIDILSNGFKLRTTNAIGNASANTYIFLAFAEAPFKSANAR